MSQLRGLVQHIILEALAEDEQGVVNFEGYKGYDLEAKCNYCNVELWLVWKSDHPAHRWTECGGIGEGSCNTRRGYDDDEDVLDLEPIPPTMRSPERHGASTKLKRSV